MTKRIVVFRNFANAPNNCSLLFFKASILRGPPSLLFSGNRGAVSPGSKQPRPITDHSSKSFDEVKNDWIRASSESINQSHIQRFGLKGDVNSTVCNSLFSHDGAQVVVIQQC
jgi:hypothetical protein